MWEGEGGEGVGGCGRMVELWEVEWGGGGEGWYGVGGEMRCGGGGVGWGGGSREVRMDVSSNHTDQISAAPRIGPDPWGLSKHDGMVQGQGTAV